MRVPLVLKALAAACVAAAVGWWLLADTVRYYSRTDESRPLRVSFWGDFQEYQMWQELRAAWEADHPDVPIKYEYVVLRYDEKMKQLLVGNAAPDVMLFQDEPMPGFIRDERFEDLTPYLKTRGQEVDLSDFWPTAVESFGRYETKEGRRAWHQYGIPNWGGCNLVFYNKRAFERAGIRVETRPVRPDPVTGRLPPGLRRQGAGWVVNDEAWTIDEFVRVAKLLTIDEDGDGRIDQFGFMLPWSIYWLPWHWALGARVLIQEHVQVHYVYMPWMAFSPPWCWPLGMLIPQRCPRGLAWYGPQCERSLQLWQDLRFKLHVSPTRAELGSMGQNVGFLTGRIAMFSNGPWCMPFLNSTDSPYDVLHTPRGPGGLRATRITWDALILFKGSKKKPLAWQFIHHLVSPRCQEIMAKYQRSIPARKSAKDTFIRHNPRVSTWKFVAATEEYGWLQPISEYWSQMSLAWYEASDLLLADRPADRLTPAEAIGKLLSKKDLVRKLPPLDPAAAKRYREIYEKRRKSR